MASPTPPSLDALIDAALSYVPPASAPTPLPLGVYRHYKNQHFYEVIGTVRHTETEELLVLYRSLYSTPSNPFGLWVRPFDMFLETIDHNGSRVKRFTLVRETKTTKNNKKNENEKKETIEEKTVEKDTITTTPSVVTESAVESATTPAAAAVTSPANAATSTADSTITAPTSSAAAASSTPAAPSQSTAVVAAPAAAASSAPARCRNPNCRPHAMGTARCGHCRSVWYCSRDCQLADREAHKVRCLTSSEVTLAHARTEVAAGPRSWLRALHILDLLQSNGGTLSAKELEEVVTVEHHLRMQLMDRHFDFAELYKNPRKIFQSESDGRSTWPETLLEGLFAVEHAPEVFTSSSFTEAAPLIIYWLGARDGNEGEADFDGLNNLFHVPTVIYLIGTPASGAAAGLSPAREKVFRNIRVRRVVGLFPVKSVTLPPAHYVAIFNAGLDANFDTWCPAIDALMFQQAHTPIVFVTGYSMDQSFFSSEPILRALGAKVILQPRRSPYGFTLMYPHTSNHHILAFQGAREEMVSTIARTPKERQAQFATIKRQLIKRGFDIRQ